MRDDGDRLGAVGGTVLQQVASAPDQKPGDAKKQGINDVGTWSAAFAAGRHSNSAPVAQSAPATSHVPAPKLRWRVSLLAACG